MPAPTFYNDIEFKAEDAIAAVLAVVADNLGGAPIALSLASEDLATSHVAIIADDFEPHQNPPRGGNFAGIVRIKVVTSFDEQVPNTFANLRALHRQRVGMVRDTLMSSTLDADLTTAGRAVAGNTGFTVQGFNFGRVVQRVANRAWITEWTLLLQSVCGSNL